MKIQCTSHGVPRENGRACEDAWRVQQRDTTTIAALADGMGSARLGGAAANRAVEMITDYYLGRPQAWSPRRALLEFAGRINRVFYQESQLQHGTPELLCTLCVVVIESGMLYGLNVGDSPVFIRRKDSTCRLSEDHVHSEGGMEHVLTRALGATAVLEPYTFETPIESGDVVLLCSDGVSRALDERGLDSLLAQHRTARSIVSSVRELVAEKPELADDASAVVLDVVDRGWRDRADVRPFEVLDALCIGERIDDYTLVRPLQAGERVWEAKHKTGTRHVLKFPSLDARDDEARRDAFMREAWQAARIDSEDFVSAHIPPLGSLRYYVMDFIEAPTLADFLRSGRLPVEDSITLARFLLRCGQSLLAHDIVHGDIKPENILVLRGADGGPTRFKLLDLGSAAEIYSVTTRAGTASYLAPERFHGSPATERTELFSIGVTLYLSLTGSFPYGEIERFQTPRFETTPRPVSRANVSAPPWLDAVIARALAPDPERRYRNFSEMVYDFDHVDQVAPFYRKDAPLVERNPVLFYKLLCAALFATVVFLAMRLAVRG